MAFRFDSHPLGNVERTPSGALKIPAGLTRAGVFSYSDPSGKIYREYRPPEEVLRADALAGWEDVPVTIGHPPSGVTPESYQALNVGHVRAGSVRAETDRALAAGVVVASRKDAIEGVNARKLVELSGGYDCRVDETPGVTPEGVPGVPAGQAYDRVQRDITPNHIALLAQGKGRLGGACALRLDAAGNAIQDPIDDATAQETDDMKIKITRLDGKEIELDAAEAVAVLTAERDAEKVRADAGDKRLAEIDAREAQARRDSLVAKVKACGVEVKGDETDRALMVAAIMRKDSKFDHAKQTDTYVQVRFDMIDAPPPAPAAPGSLPAAEGSGARAVTDSLDAPAETRADAEPDLQADPHAYAAQLERNALNRKF